MDQTLIVRGRYAGRTFIPDGPLPDAEGPAELVITPAPAWPRGSVADAFGSAAGASFGWFSWLQAVTVAPIEVMASLNCLSVHASWVQSSKNHLTGSGYALAVALPCVVGAFALVVARYFRNDLNRALLLAVVWFSAVPLLYDVAQRIVDAWQLFFISLALFLFTGSPRLRRLAAGDFDALLLALAGLERLGRIDEAGGALAVDDMVPAPGQGALAVEARDDDADALGPLAVIDDPDSHARLRAERALTRALDASCRTPIGAHAWFADAGMELVAFVGLPDGSAWIRDRLSADAADPEALGRAVAERLLAAGAGDLLRAAEAAAA